MNSNGRAPTTVATWPGPMKPSSRRSGDSSSARSGGTIVTWLHMHEKFAIALGLRPLQRERGRRRRRLEADREEDDLAVRVLAARSAARRAASRPCARRRPRPWRRAACRSQPGTRIMSPKQVKITSGSCASAMPSSTRPIGITQTGQPGPWTSSTFVGQQVVDAVLVDRVGVPAAHLHHLVVAARLDRRQDLAGDGPAELGVAELVDELHATAVRPRRASAMPAWTSTRSPGATAPTSSDLDPRRRPVCPPASPRAAREAVDGSTRDDAHAATADVAAGDAVVVGAAGRRDGVGGAIAACRPAVTRSRSPSAPRAPARTRRPSARSSASVACASSSSTFESAKPTWISTQSPGLRRRRRRRRAGRR